MSVDLTTKYLGLVLNNPLIVAACPLTRESYRVELLEQSGAAAVVMYSLFAEQVASDKLHQLGETPHADNRGVGEIVSPDEYVGGLNIYLKNIELAKRSVQIPIIGSLNGSEMGDWVEFAKLIEQAGADALELNIYFVPTDPTITGSQVEEKYLEIAQAVRDQIEIPLSVKLGPFFSSLPNFAARMSQIGVNGLVLFNRFIQPDIDVNTFAVSPHLSLSTSSELLLPLRWIAILKSRFELSFASSSGAHSSEDIAKMLLAGADVVSMASALLKNGPSHMTKMLDELTIYMEEKEFATVDDMRGFSVRRPEAETNAFERANYIKSIVTYENETAD